MEGVAQPVAGIARVSDRGYDGLRSLSALESIPDSGAVDSSGHLVDA
jgi:hypothetical protein